MWRDEKEREGGREEMAMAIPLGSAVHPHHHARCTARRWMGREGGARVVSLEGKGMGEWVERGDIVERKGRMGRPIIHRDHAQHNLSFTSTLAMLCAIRGGEHADGKQHRSWA